MSSCQDMEKGEIYACERCGVEIMVINESKYNSGKSKKADSGVKTERCKFNLCHGEPNVWEEIIED